MGGGGPDPSDFFLCVSNCRKRPFAQTRDERNLYGSTAAQYILYEYDCLYYYWCFEKCVLCWLMRYGTFIQNISDLRNALWKIHCSG